MKSAMAKHILVKTKPEALSIKEKLDKGQDFAKLARQFSTCPTRQRGGDLGEIFKGKLVKPVEQVIFNQPLSKVHGPIKSKFGYHLIIVYFRGS
ncbi:MAG: peptidylprolyl isomerase [Ghiorsea sp.]|nr:peptidylprolyl isomerase [Ghiorsea sp.]MDQ7004934.1 peptidylprolyl isomerase [Ghiorsea sp.]